jgi:hypothetical protein
VAVEIRVEDGIQRTVIDSVPARNDIRLRRMSGGNYLPSEIALLHKIIDTIAVRVYIVVVYKT